MHPFRKLFDQRSLRVSDYAIFNSNVNYNGWKSNYDVSVPMSVIHNGVDVEKFYPRDVVRGEYVLFVGSTEQKGISAVLDYASGCDRPVHIVGSTENYNQSNVISHGRVSQDRLSELYSGAVATIHPAKFESFGNIVLESLACGTPAVTTPTCGASELLTKDTGVVTKDISYGVELATEMDPVACRNIAKQQQWSDVSEETMNIAHSLLQWN
jgi:glycosyltransferase involved in cell wall biosynthesis